MVSMGKYVLQSIFVVRPSGRDFPKHTYLYLPILTLPENILTSYLPLVILTVYRLHIFKINIYETTSKQFTLYLLLLLWVISKTTLQ